MVALPKQPLPLCVCVCIYVCICAWRERDLKAYGCIPFPRGNVHFVISCQVPPFVGEICAIFPSDWTITRPVGRALELRQKKVMRAVRAYLYTLRLRPWSNRAWWHAYKRGQVKYFWSSHLSAWRSGEKRSSPEDEFERSSVPFRTLVKLSRERERYMENAMILKIERRNIGISLMTRRSLSKLFIHLQSYNRAKKKK